ncbi:MAG: CotH kinase family protein [Paludibacteraceae bacterium]|nr:CotH kinase family protein [Paludibacteraceae bacterium]
MKKFLTAVSLFFLSASFLCAQPDYLVGSAKVFNELSSSEPSGSNMTVCKRTSQDVACKVISAHKDSLAWLKFAYGASGWNTQWAGSASEEKTVSVNTVEEAVYGNADAKNLRIQVYAGKYYTVNISRKNADANNKFIAIETDFKPVAITSATCQNPEKGKDATVSITLSESKNASENVRFAYSTDGQNYTSGVLTGSGTSYSGTIPASVNVEGATITYFAYTLLSEVALTDSDFDLMCLSSQTGEYSFADKPIAQATIKAHHNSVNPQDATDFASLYVSDNGGLDSDEYTGDCSYLWQISTDNGATWSKYKDGKKNNTNNIRPIKPAQYRCQVSRQDKTTLKEYSTYSNTIEVTQEYGETVTISSKLPVIIVRTDEKEFPVEPYDGFLSSNEALAAGKAKRSVDVKILWDETSTDDTSITYTEEDLNNPDRLYYDRKARMNYRGSSSMGNARKSYAFVVGADECTNKGTWVKDKKKMFNINDTKDKDFILYAAEGDDTKMRNILTMRMYEDMTGLWNPHARYVRLYVDGKDLGVYVFMEKVKEQDSRVQVADDGYIFKFDRTDLVDRYGTTDGGRNCFGSDRTGWKDIHTYGLVVDQGYEVVFPEWDEEEFTEQTWNSRIDYLRDKINTFEGALAQNNYVEVRKHLDYESWADNFIINEFVKNIDGYRLSQQYVLYDKSSKIQAQPLWDMELGFNANGYQREEKGCTSTHGYLYDNDFVHNDPFTIPFWWNGKDRETVGGNGLMGDDCFKAMIRYRWEKHIAEGGALTDASIYSHIDNFITSLGKDSRPEVITDWVTRRRANFGALISEYPQVLKSASISGGNVNKIGDKLELTAQANGEGEYTYQWYFKKDGDKEWKIIDGATGSTYTINAISKKNVGTYKCLLTSSICKCMSYSIEKEILIDKITVSVSSNDDEMGSVSGGGEYYIGSDVEITATANAGYNFTEWNDGDDSAIRTIEDVCTDQEYTAYFEPISTEEPSNQENQVIVYAKDKTIHIENCDTDDISINKLDGSTISQGKRIQKVNTAGIYIVNANGNKQKIAVE